MADIRSLEGIVGPGCVVLPSILAYFACLSGTFSAGIYKGAQTSQGNEADVHFIGWFVGNLAASANATYWSHPDYGTEESRNQEALRNSVRTAILSPILFGSGYGIGYLMGTVLQ